MVGPPAGFDTVLDLCTDSHRRIILGVLADQRRSLTTDDLAKAIVKHNHHSSLTAVPDETIPKIKTALYHVHIPKLAASGLVEYDDERGLVTPTTEFDRAESHLSALIDADPNLARPVEL